MNPRLFLLALGTFAIGAEGFALVGLLPSIASDLRVPIALAGQLVTAFALVFALGAPLLAALTGSWPRRPLLAGALALFTAAAALAALAPSFPLLLAARVLAAVGAALFTPNALAMATSMVAPTARGRAISVVAGGTSVAVVVSGPLGVWAGGHFGWHATYGVVAALSALAAVSCLLLPASPAPPRVGLRARAALLVQPRIALTLGASALGTLGWFVLHPYIALLLGQLGRLDAAGVSGLLLAYGLASVAGNPLGGFLADRWGATRTAALSLGGMALALALLPLAATSPAGALAALVGLALSGWMLGPAQQARLIALAPAGAPALLALSASSTWLGIGGGAALGGAVMGAASAGALGAAGAACEVLALGAVWLSTRGKRRAHAAHAAQRPALAGGSER